MRASEFGGCIRAIVASELGYLPLAPPPRMQQVFDAGNDAEVKALETLARKGWAITDQQKEVEYLGITGHIDGLDVDTDSVVEIKSMGREPFAQWLNKGFDMGGLMERYKWQTSIYQWALARQNLLENNQGQRVDPAKTYTAPAQLVMVGYAREDGAIHILHRDLPFHTETAIRARVAEIHRWVEMGELPGCSIRPDNYACPFLHLHIPEEKDRDELVEGLGEQYRALNLQAGVVKEQIADVKKLLVEAMGDRMEVDCPNVRVSRYMQANPATVDRDAMKQDGIYEKYLVPGSKSERLKVTLREGAEDGVRTADSE